LEISHRPTSAILALPCWGVVPSVSTPSGASRFSALWGSFFSSHLTTLLYRCRGTQLPRVTLVTLPLQAFLPLVPCLGSCLPRGASNAANPRVGPRLKKTP
jgi:hypothetical protein